MITIKPQKISKVDTHVSGEPADTCSVDGDASALLMSARSDAAGDTLHASSSSSAAAAATTTQDTTVIEMDDEGLWLTGCTIACL